MLKLRLEKKQEIIKGAENFVQAFSAAARLEVVTRFAEQNPNHPLAQEIIDKLSELTGKAFESVDWQAGDYKRQMDYGKNFSSRLSRFRLDIKEQIGNTKDKRRQKSIADAADELYEKVKKELDLYDLNRLAKGE